MTTSVPGDVVLHRSHHHPGHRHWHIHRRNVLVRRLDAVKTLDTVRVFCLDKTGTLTLNHMTVVVLHVGGRRIVADEQGFRLVEHADDPLQSREFLRLLEVVALCNELQLNGGQGRLQINGSATETALIELVSCKSCRLCNGRARLWR